MVRRRLTVKRIEPWSVLKFGAVANLALLAIGLLVAYVFWFIIERLNIIDQVCAIATDVGFTQCGVNAGNLFRALVLLGLLGVVVQTAVLVFLSFLHNLIADLTGGLALSVIDDTPGAAQRAETATRTAAAVPPVQAEPRPRATPPPREEQPSSTRAHHPVTSGRAGEGGRGGPATGGGEDLFSDR